MAAREPICRARGLRDMDDRRHCAASEQRPDNDPQGRMPAWAKRAGAVATHTARDYADLLGLIVCAGLFQQAASCAGKLSSAMDHRKSAAGAHKKEVQRYELTDCVKAA